jgi:hypothetical protein
VVLWVIQIALGIKFLSVTYTHGFGHNSPKMKPAVQKMGASARPMLFVAALVMFLGCIGLILPDVLGVLKWLTSLSAAILAVMALVSIAPHVRFRAKPIIVADVILFVLCVFVAIGRWKIAPL